MKQLCLFLFALVTILFISSVQEATSVTTSVSESYLSLGNRLLVMTLSFDLTHSDAVDLILMELVNMCEGGFYVTVIFYVTQKWSDELYTMYRRRTYCYRTNDSVNITFSYHEASVGTWLSAEHRKNLHSYLPHYDLFLYHEDDIIFRWV